MPSPSNRLTVVIVEDHASLRELTKDILERTKKFETVGEAANGDEALTVCSRTKPDLVLLDLKMPGRDGFQALPDLRRVTPKSKIVAYSMLQKAAAEPRALSLGAVAFIEKDVESSELVERLLALFRVDGDANNDGGGSPPARPANTSRSFFQWRVPRWSMNPAPARIS